MGVKMRKRLLALLVVPLLLLNFLVNSWADTTLPKKKQTDLGLYITAKEAFTKALGTGFGNGISLKNIEILNDKSGKPSIKLTGNVETHLKKKIS